MVRLLIALFVCSINVSGQTNIYVDPIGGSDEKSGTSFTDRIQSLTRLNALISSYSASVLDTIYLVDTIHYGEIVVSSKNYTSSKKLNITTLNYYTNNKKATISGFGILTGFTNLGNNLWSVTDSRLPSDYKYTVNFGANNYQYLKFMGAGLLINGTRQRISKYPSGINSALRFTNKDVSGKNWLEDNVNTFAAGYWNNAELVVQRDDWSTEIVNVTSYTSAGRYNISGGEWQGSSLGNTGATGGIPNELPNYYIVNHLNAISPTTPYYYNRSSTQVTVHYSGNLNNQRVEGGILNYVVRINNSKYIDINNIAVTGGNIHGVFIESSSNILVRNCYLNYSKFASIFVQLGDSTYIQDNIIEDAMDCGIVMAVSKNSYIERNRLFRIGNTFDNIGDNNATHRIAILLTRPNGLSTVRYNYIKDVGYNAFSISYFRMQPTDNNGSDWPFSFECNFIENACLLGNDMGAYHSFNVRNQPATYRRVRNNIVYNVPGTTVMRKRVDSRTFAAGIYFDERTSYVQVDSNTVEKISSGAFFANGNSNVTYRNNQAYNWHNNGTLVNGGGFYINTFQLGTSTNMTYKKNYMFEDFTDQSTNYKSFFTIRYRQSDLTSFVVDSNYYFSPFSTNTSNFKKGEYMWSGTSWVTVVSGVWQHINLTNWKLVKTGGWENASTLNTTQYESIIVYKNWSPVERTFYFAATTAVDKAGNTLSGSITVAPHHSEVVRFNGLNNSDEDLYIGYFIDAVNIPDDPELIVPVRLRPYQLYRIE